MSLPRVLPWLVVATLPAAACESGVDALPDHPRPLVDASHPSIVVEGETAAITVAGSGFVEGAALRWDGQPLPTTYSGSTRLSGSLTGLDLAGPGGAVVDVLNPEPGGGASEPLDIVIGYPRPALASLSPTSAQVVVTPGVELQLLGSRFATTGSGARVYWRGVPLETRVVSSTEIRAVLTQALLRTAGTTPVWIENPAPGGGASDSLSLELLNPVPVITTTEPPELRIDFSTLRIGVHGTGFAMGASASVGGAAVTTTQGSHEHLSLEFPESLVVPGEYTPVVVFNGGPGGGFSNVYQLLVWKDPPWVSGISPSHVEVGSPGFTLAILGRDFSPDATVTLGGSPRPATVVSPYRIEAPIDAADLAVPDTVEVRVIHPFPGGYGAASLHIYDPSAVQ